jgi:hypothetical protein
LSTNIALSALAKPAKNDRFRSRNLSSLG